VIKALLAFVLVLQSFARADDFADANQAYAAGNYERAVTGYKKVLQHGDFANAWFNCGNALFRQEKLGQAALAYERALLAQPSHPEAAANLKFVRNKTNARVGEAPWVEKAWRYVEQPLVAWLLVGEAWLGFLLIGSVALGKRSRAALAVGVLFVLLGFGGVGALHYAREELGKVAIAVQAVDARTEPADRAALAGALGAGSRVQIVSTQGEWTYCVLPDGARGWIPTKRIERLVAGTTL
jgi:tetratricopeptide (TPR) repeat protein